MLLLNLSFIKALCKGSKISGMGKEGKVYDPKHPQYGGMECKDKPVKIFGDLCLNSTKDYNWGVFWV